MASGSADEDAYRPFDIEVDYRTFVDGKRRADGVASFFDSRGLDVPIEVQRGRGNEDWSIDELVPDAWARGLSRRHRIPGVPARSRFIALSCRQSEHREALVAAAGITDYFESRVDGQRATADGLAGKPAPTPTWRRQVTRLRGGGLRRVRGCDFRLQVYRAGTSAQ